MGDFVGTILIVLFIVHCVRTAVYGYRRGLVARRIRYPDTDDAKYFEGSRARLFGWFLVLAGILLSAFFAYGLLLILSKHFLLW
jgi:hypothetical protein